MRSKQTARRQRGWVIVVLVWVRSQADLAIRRGYEAQSDLSVRKVDTDSCLCLTNSSEAPSDGIHTPVTSFMLIAKKKTVKECALNGENPPVPLGCRRSGTSLRVPLKCCARHGLC